MAASKKSSSEIIVGFSKETKPEDIKILEAKYKLTIIKKFKRIYAIHYKINEGKIAELIKLLQNEKIVTYAEPNGKVSKKN